MKSKRVSNAKQLRNFLNTLSENELNAYIICTYSDDVPGGEADVVVGQEGTDDVFIEIVGGSDMV